MQRRYAIASTEAMGRADPGWDLLLLCLAGFVLTSVGRIHQLFPVLTVLRPAILTAGLAILLLLVDYSRVRRFTGLSLVPNRYLVAFVAWMALSVPGALWSGAAFATLVDFSKTALMFLVIVTAIRNTRDAERLALVYFASAVLFTLVVLIRFDLDQEGRLAKLYFYDANDFATLAVTALPLGLYFAFTGGRVRRVAAWGGIAALAIGFVWSGSRGGFLALMAVIGYVLLRYSSMAARWRVSALVVIGVLSAFSASESYWARMRTMFDPTHDYNLTDEQGRMQIWRRGMAYTLEHPVFGVGAGNFSTAEGTLSPLAQRQERGRGVKWGPPHNSYLQVAAELGVPALLLFAGFVLAVLRSLGAVRALNGPRPRTRDATKLAHALSAAVIGFLVGAFFLTLAYHAMFYVLGALAAGLLKATRRASQEWEPVVLDGARGAVLEQVERG